MRRNKDNEILSIKWLNFCIYWRIPISILFGISNWVKFYGGITNWNFLIILFLIIDVSTIILYIITFIFARNYTKAGYRLLYSLFIIETITYSLTTANNGVFNSTSEYIYALLIYLLVCGLLWFLPNHIYLRKRKHLFFGKEIIDDKKEETEENEETFDVEEEKEVIPYLKSNNKIVKNKKRFCKLCGGKIDENKKCVKCGKQYFKIRPIKSKLSIILIAIITISLGFNIYQFISIQKNNSKINNLNGDIKTLKNNVSSLEDENVQLRLEKWDYIGKANFLDNYIVIVPSNGTRYYYTYDCFQKKFSGQSFYAYNINTATVQGYRQGGC